MKTLFLFSYSVQGLHQELDVCSAGQGLQLRPNGPQAQVRRFQAVAGSLVEHAQRDNDGTHIP